MPTKEGPFLTFWRAVNAELERLGEAPATAGEAYGYGYDWRYAAASIRHRRANPEWATRYTPPAHQRGSGKTVTP
jgi:hypothetical protein